MKKTRRLLLGAGLMLCTLASFASNDKEMDRFIDRLMAKMTLEEKIGQLNLQPAGEVTTGAAMDTQVGGLVAKGQLGSILNLVGRDRIRAIQQVAVEKSRLGIPLLVGLDVIHGYHTILPIPLAQSCSWDMKGIEQAARIAAEECSADGISWTYSPMVDIALDARWGRIAEGGGEDPYLVSEIARAMVRGYQRDLSQETDILACLKHYALYGAVEAGRDYNTVDMSHLRMYNQYFPPYKAAVEAGVASVMTSFNLVDGQHATANRWLLDDVLRKQWNFQGFVVTDYGSIGEMTNHGFGGLKDNSVAALKAGTDMDMCSLGFIQTLKDALQEGRITKRDIDVACRRVLEAKYRVGLFQDPYRHCPSDDVAAKRIFTDEHRRAARQFTAETFVLLRNERNVLPLRQDMTIALIGPNADTTEGLLGTWCVAKPDSHAYPSLRKAMEEAVQGKGRVIYAQGCNLTDDQRLLKGGDSPYIPIVDARYAHDEAMSAARQADVIVCAMGEGANWSGESHSRAAIEMPAVQQKLLRDLCALGKPVVLLNFAGRPTAFGWEAQTVPAIMNVWFGGTEMGPALCDVLFGRKSPSGRLTTSLPRSTGQEPLYYNHLRTGRPTGDDDPTFHVYSSNYLDAMTGPAFPFGYGLTYSTVKYGDLDVKASGRGIIASLTLENTGLYDVDEVVQLYINDPVCSVSRPVKELKAFQRVHLRVKEKVQVSLALNEDALSYYDMNGRLTFEPGDFHIMVGPNSRDVQTKTVTLK